MTTSVRVSFGSVTFSGSEIKSAVITEEIDPISMTLPISTFELTLYSTDGGFSILSPSGFYASLQYKQSLDVYATVNSVETYMGRFYLDRWESKGPYEASFYASDGIGLLNEMIHEDHTWGQILDGTQTDVGWIMRVMLINNGFTTVIPNDLLYNTPAYGWLQGRITFRQQLQRLAFVGGAYITCSRSSSIVVKYTELVSSIASFDYVLGTDDVSMNDELTMKPLVTGVDITTHNYAYDNLGDVRVYETTLPVGYYDIKFSEPISNVVVYNAATQGGGIDFHSVRVDTQGSVYLTGRKFVDSKTNSVLNTTGLPSTVTPNVVKVTDIPLLHLGIGTEVCQRLYDYYQQRYVLKTKVYGMLIEVGSSVMAATQGGWITGIVERVVTSLANGIVTELRIVGTTSGCTNVLTSDLTVTTGNTQTYADCLDAGIYTIDLQGTATLSIT